MSDLHSQVGTPPSIAPDAVREALRRVLESDEFRTSKRCQEFLEYVVQRTLDGHADDLKERTIGMELFGRSSSYDPSNDATVRVKAREVRKRLSVYYATQGGADPVRIGLHAGTYVPTFHAASEADRDSDDASSDAGSAILRRTMVALAISAVILIGLTIAGIRALYHPASGELGDFWTPVLHRKIPVWLCASSIPVYRPKSEAAPTKIDDLILLNDRFVAVDDLAAMTRVSNLLARWRQPYRLRVGNGIAYSDLRTAPAILIGYSYTRWQEIGHEGRFFVTASSVLDNGTARWGLASFQDDPNLHDDYAVVSRFVDPNSGHEVIEIAGISHYGTEAAAEAMTDPVEATSILSQLPAGWQSRNVQIVLHVKIISRSPGIPRVVATHIW